MKPPSHFMADVDELTVMKVHVRLEGSTADSVEIDKLEGLWVL